ncbi:hypothetical protein OJ253_2501 [Cryptosporidium canis]|uniref:Uncharacterized protein n=1 Tax=Cryptosporidium canis TaxID=195482 RepID=A0A9D5DI33_9CRYT|nr:hypothetical protein OJ253_2501 [Cryptosporidium canis]
MNSFQSPGGGASREDVLLFRFIKLFQSVKQISEILVELFVNTDGGPGGCKSLGFGHSAAKDIHSGNHCNTVSTGVFGVGADLDSLDTHGQGHHLSLRLLTGRRLPSGLATRPGHFAGRQVQQHRPGTAFPGGCFQPCWKQIPSVITKNERGQQSPDASESEKPHGKTSHPDKDCPVLGRLLQPLAHLLLPQELHPGSSSSETATAASPSSSRTWRSIGSDQEEEEGEDEGQDRDYSRGSGNYSQEEGNLTDTDRADEEGCNVRCPQRRRSSSSAGKSLLVYELDLQQSVWDISIQPAVWERRDAQCLPGFQHPLPAKPQERHQVTSLDHQGAGGQHEGLRREKTQEQGLRQAGAAPQQYDAAALAGLEQSQSQPWGGGRAEGLWPAWSDYESAGQ